MRTYGLARVTRPALDKGTMGMFHLLLLSYLIHLTDYQENRTWTGQILEYRGLLA